MAVGVVQAQAAGQRLEHVDRRVDRPTLLEPRVPGDRDTGEQRNLLAAQAGGAPAAPTGRPTSSGCSDSRRARRNAAELVASVHPPIRSRGGPAERGGIGTRIRCRRGDWANDRSRRDARRSRDTREHRVAVERRAAADARRTRWPTSSKRRLGSPATVGRGARRPARALAVAAIPKVLIVGHHDTVFPLGTWRRDRSRWPTARRPARACST